MSTPVLHLLAGPNGAGKSTLGTRVLQPVTHLRFINADLIAADQWPGDEVAHAYEAAEVAAAARETLMEAREPFITETVFSHSSKVDLTARATRLGYLVHLHVVMVPVEVTVGRVEHRVRHGGHAVPEQKIRERYDRLWPLIATARAIADRTTFYDNTSARTPFRTVATYRYGAPVTEPDWPLWTPEVLR